MVAADANPGIGGLNAATRLTLEEFRGTPGAVAGPAAAAGAGAAPEPGASNDEQAASAGPAAPVSWRSGADRPPPNLGPPPPRLDWRKRRS